MSSICVVNASPLIVLAKAGYLELLKDMADDVLIPAEVAAEVLSGSISDAARIAVEGGWGRQVEAAAIPTEVAALNLDPGETAVITAALAHGNCLVVLDDSTARQRARALGLPVIGTLGIVLRARRQGRIPSAAAVLSTLKAVGLYLDDSLVRSALEAVGE